MELDHLVEELLGGRLAGQEADGVAQVLAGLFEDLRVVGQGLVLVAGDDVAGVECGDVVDVVEPCLTVGGELEGPGGVFVVVGVEGRSWRNGTVASAALRVRVSAAGRPSSLPPGEFTNG
ncbi:hypothetical protein [Streptomyces sp. V3I7]|uniref:hypothetical protein n=1 Tax=Streptomyces sp. V3I7 TaxID=3042278 RepID=UPI0027870E9B|nr:hypothetical protein [Streptomyces sp. V3I7]MDQ0989663.1 hypothetical protein [Streptomyces sp. V3I7]